MLGNIVVHDMADTGDVDAAGGDVGRDHHLVTPALESLESIDALLLGAVGVHDGNLVALVLKLAGDPVGPVLRAAKHDHAVVVGAVEHRLEQIELLCGGNGIEGVLDGLGCGTADSDGDLLRIAETPGGKPLDLLGDRCREKERLALLRALLDDAAHIGKESHVQHAIDFIEHKDLEVLERDLPLLHEVKETARCGDDNVGAPLKGLPLSTVPHTTENHHGTKVREGS